MTDLDNIHIRYDFTGSGCADCYIIKNGESFCFSVSYGFSSGIDELLETLLSFFIETGWYDKYLIDYPKTSGFKWDNEGSYTIWEFTLQPKNVLEVSINHFMDEDRSQVGNDELLESLSFRCDLYNFIGAVCRTTKKVIQDFGFIGYAREWDYQPFPLSQLILLQDLYEKKVPSLFSDKSQNKYFKKRSSFEESLKYLSFEED